MRSSRSIEPELILLAINQCIALVLQESFNVVSLSADNIKNVEYYPVWTMGRQRRKGRKFKKLLRIHARLHHAGKFRHIHPSAYYDAGFTIDELLSFLEKSSATRYRHTFQNTYPKKKKR